MIPLLVLVNHMIVSLPERDSWMVWVNFTGTKLCPRQQYRRWPTSGRQCRRWDSKHNKTRLIGIIHGIYCGIYCNIIRGIYCNIIRGIYCNIIRGIYCSIIRGIYCSIIHGVYCTAKGQPVLIFHAERCTWMQNTNNIKILRSSVVNVTEMIHWLLGVNIVKHGREKCDMKIFQSCLKRVLQ